MATSGELLVATNTCGAAGAVVEDTLRRSVRWKRPADK